MEKEFVPYDIALAMKELGFDDKSLAMYTDDSGSIRLLFDGSISGSNINVWKSKKMTSAPLYQQAFRWFREEYNLWVEISKPFTWLLTISDKKQNKRISLEDYNNYVEPKTYEEAQEDCLRKLIEIVKENLD